MFATGAFAEIRLWHITSRRELVRIRVPNVSCTCLAFTADGKCIVAGWSDGKLRAFGPQSGKLLWQTGAHHQAVTAVAACAEADRIVSGGKDGMVRLWSVRSCSLLVSSWLAHRSRRRPGSALKRTRRTGRR